MKITYICLIGVSLFSFTALSHAETNLWSYTASSQIHLRPTVGGIVSGLTGTLVLQNKEVPLTVGTDGIFAFQNTATRDTYNVTVLMQPASQICTVTNGSGRIINGNITNISVQCITN